ncbi:hypothetical protein MMC17_001678 [Xylographa soralifera]|nr:hypothetical protein [Xylographa soralifera]
MMQNTSAHRKVFTAYGVVLLVSWIASLIAAFLECQPIALYWQVVPNPGPCVEARIWYFTYGSLNIFTNIILVVLPMATLLRTPHSRLRSANVLVSDNRNLYIAMVYCVFCFSIVSTTARLIFYTKDPSNGLNQAIWGGLECLTAAYIVLAPTLCSLFSTVADRRRDEEAKTGSRGMENDSTENIIIPTSDNQRRSVRNLQGASSGRGKSIRMLNIFRPRPSSATLEDAFDLPRQLGFDADYWTNLGHLAPEDTIGTICTPEGDATREAWTDEDLEANHPGQSDNSSVRTRTDEEAAFGPQTYKSWGW